MDETESQRSQNSAAGQAGDNVGMVIGIFLPGPGKVKAAVSSISTTIYVNMRGIRNAFDC